MGTLTAAERADLEAEYAELLVDTCYVRHRTQVDDGEGGFTYTITSTDGPLPCAYGPLGTTEGPRGVQIAADATAQIALPAHTAVQGTDQIVCHLDGQDTDVITAEVKAVARMGAELWRIVQVEELQPA